MTKELKCWNCFCDNHVTNVSHLILGHLWGGREIDMIHFWSFYWHSFWRTNKNTAFRFTLKITCNLSSLVQDNNVGHKVTKVWHAIISWVPIYSVPRNVWFPIFPFSLPHRTSVMFTEPTPEILELGLFVVRLLIQFVKPIVGSFQIVYEQWSITMFQTELMRRKMIKLTGISTIHIRQFYTEKCCSPRLEIRHTLLKRITVIQSSHQSFDIARKHAWYNFIIFIFLCD